MPRRSIKRLAGLTKRSHSEGTLFNGVPFFARKMTVKYIQDLFPLLSKIESETLRNKVIEITRKSMEEGGWNEKNVALCPVSLNRRAAKTNLIEHINSVAESCDILYEILRKYPDKHRVSWNHDLVLAGALLHDVGKWREYCLIDDVPALSAEGKTRKHPIIGAALAAREGLPDEIIDIIALHSAEGDKATHSAESELVRNVDRLVFQTMIHGIPYNDV